MLIRSADGQLADIMLDSSALNATIMKAETTRSEFVRETAEGYLRHREYKNRIPRRTDGQGQAVSQTALCDTATLDKDARASAAESVEQLAGFISKPLTGTPRELIKTSAAALERWCDDMLMSHVYKARYIFLGWSPDSLLYRKGSGDKGNVRIILSCKRNKLPSEAIRERVRKVYV